MTAPEEPLSLADEAARLLGLAESDPDNREAYLSAARALRRPCLKGGRRAIEDSRKVADVAALVARGWRPYSACMRVAKTISSGSKLRSVAERLHGKWEKEKSTQQF